MYSIFGSIKWYKKVFLNGQTFYKGNLTKRVSFILFRQFLQDIEKMLIMELAKLTKQSTLIQKFGNSCQKNVRGK